MHLAVDYPDANVREKTVAVRNFVKANPALDHVVIALTRSADPRRANLIRGDGAGDESVYSMRYWGLPLGILLFPAMAIVAWRIRGLLRRERIEVDFVHAHKLCFEGISGYLLAAWLQVPLFCSVRAEAESKVLRYLPHYRPLFRRIIRRCGRLYYVSPWFRPVLERLFPDAVTRGENLPNFCPGTVSPIGRHADPDRFVTIMHLDIYKKKGLDRLLPAFARFAARHPQVSLDIVGRGTPETMRVLEALIGRSGLRGRARLVGPVGREQLMEQMPGYAAMCLPSHNETFGMVYVEAMLSGVPIMFSRGTGIDGFIDDFDGAVVVDPCSVDDIEAGLEKLRSEHPRLRAWLLANHGAIATRFDAEHYIAMYNHDLGVA